MNLQCLVAAYFALQGIAVLLWWSLLWCVPTSRAYFLLDPKSETSLLAFWLPDLLLLALGSLIGSALVVRNHHLAGAILWFVCGTVGYASLYVVAYALQTGIGWLGVIMMVPAAILSIICTATYCRIDTILFRQTCSVSKPWNLVKTAFQIIVIWSTLLFFVPYLIRRIEALAGIDTFDSPSLRFASITVFLVYSALGLWSGFTMASYGEGTPLPIDAPRRLVVHGPYAYVRNPMAIAGLGQGLAVGLWWGSLLVLLYVCVGMSVWQLLARPLEEEDLTRNFGNEFEEYRRHVKCWWPRRTPYNCHIASNQTTSD